MREFERSVSIQTLTPQVVEQQVVGHSLPAGRLVDRFRVTRSLALRLASVIAVGSVAAAACRPIEANLNTENNLIPPFFSRDVQPNLGTAAPEIILNSRQQVWLENTLDKFEKMGLEKQIALLALLLATALPIRAGIKGLHTYMITEGTASAKREKAFFGFIDDKLNNLTTISAGMLSTGIPAILEGKLGSLEVASGMLTVALIAALLPAWAELDRFKEKVEADILQNVLYATIGAMLGAADAGIIIEEKETSLAIVAISGLAFVTLRSFAKQSNASRRFVFDTLSDPEIPIGLRSFLTILISKRIPVDARNILQAVAELRANKDVLNKEGLLDQACQKIRKAFLEDNPERLKNGLKPIDPDNGDLDIDLGTFEALAREGIRRYIDLRSGAVTSESSATNGIKRWRRKKKRKRGHLV